MKKLLLFVSLLAALGAFAREPETISGYWIVYGTVEDVPHQVAYTVARETGVEHARWIVAAHELIEVGKNPDGSVYRVYRDEACVLYIDEDDDTILTPQERRWKVPADHACALTNRPTSFVVDVGGDGTILLHVRTPPVTRRGQEQVAITAVTGTAHVERQHQLPQLVADASR